MNLLPVISNRYIFPYYTSKPLHYNMELHSKTTVHEEWIGTIQHRNVLHECHTLPYHKMREYLLNCTVLAAEMSSYSHFP